jgi:hypothetical protein
LTIIREKSAGTEGIVSQKMSYLHNYVVENKKRPTNFVFCICVGCIGSYKGHHFTTEESTLIKCGRDVGTVLMRWLITQDTNVYQH